MTDEIVNVTQRERTPPSMAKTLLTVVFSTAMVVAGILLWLQYHLIADVWLFMPFAMVGIAGFLLAILSWKWQDDILRFKSWNQAPVNFILIVVLAAIVTSLWWSTWGLAAPLALLALYSSVALLALTLLFHIVRVRKNVYVAGKAVVLAIAAMIVIVFFATLKFSLGQASEFFLQLFSCGVALFASAFLFKVLSKWESLQASHIKSKNAAAIFMTIGTLLLIAFSILPLFQLNFGLPPLLAKTLGYGGDFLVAMTAFFHLMHIRPPSAKRAEQMALFGAALIAGVGAIWIVGATKTISNNLGLIAGIPTVVIMTSLMLFFGYRLLKNKDNALGKNYENKLSAEHKTAVGVLIALGLTAIFVPSMIVLLNWGAVPELLFLGLPAGGCGLILLSGVVHGCYTMKKQEQDGGYGAIDASREPLMSVVAGGGGGPYSTGAIKAAASGFGYNRDDFRNSKSSATAAYPSSPTHNRTGSGQSQEAALAAAGAQAAAVRRTQIRGSAVIDNSFRK